ncbi:hypothetical protein GCM10023205_36060 [Yinghuangia aomiensis]|uniref:Uncharacterized protein n=1 Tax=Yinghuangia aomiensis TaxID=676205 RepID=A0ABP9HD04_9ACTN
MTTLPPPETTPRDTPVPPDTVAMYSAELIWQDGKYLLTIHDHLTETTHTTRLPQKTVDRLPGYLTLLPQTPR